MQAVLTTAVGIQGDGFAFDAVQAGGQGLFELFPHGLFGKVGAFAHLSGGMAAQVDKRGHWQLFHLAVQFEADGFLGGERALQFFPGAAAGEGHFVGEQFFGLRHLVAALRGFFQQDEGVLAGAAGRFEGGGERCAQPAKPGAQAHEQVLEGHARDFESGQHLFGLLVK